MPTRTIFFCSSVVFFGMTSVRVVILRCFVKNVETLEGKFKNVLLILKVEKKNELIIC